MAHISLRVTDEEKELMESYATWHDISLSDAVKTAFFEKIEDKYDLRVISEYEAAEKAGEVEYITYEELIKELGLEDEIWSRVREKAEKEIRRMDKGQSRLLL